MRQYGLGCTCKWTIFHISLCHWSSNCLLTLSGCSGDEPMMRGSAAFKIAPWPMGGGAQLSPSTLHSPLFTLQLHLAARAAASDKYRLAPRVTEPESGAVWSRADTRPGDSTKIVTCYTTQTQHRDRDFSCTF